MPSRGPSAARRAPGIPEAAAGGDARPSWAALPALAVPVFLTAWILPWFRGRMRMGGDTDAFLLPVRAFYSERLAAGEFPLWDPHLFCGFPVHAEGQTGVFHPVHVLLYRFVPVHWALQAEYLLVLALAFAAAYLLARMLDVPRLGAVFAGAAFALSPFMLSHAVHLPLLAVFAHTPLACWAAYRMGSAADWRHGLRAAAGLTLIVASQLLLGSPPATYLSGLAWGVFLLAGVRDGTRRRIVPALVAAGLGTAALIGAVQWMPTLAFVQQTDRFATAASWSGSFSLPPWNLLQLLVPHAFSGVTAGDAASGNSPVEFAIYPGLGVLMLAFVGAWTRRAGLFVAGAVVAGLLMLGQYSGLSEVLNRIPIVNGFRAPARHVAVLHLFVVVLAALGTKRVLEQPDTRRLFGRVAAGLALLSLIAHAVVLSGAGIPEAAPASLVLRSAGSIVLLGALGAAVGRSLGSRLLPLFLLIAVLDAAAFGWRAGPADLPQPEVSAIARDLAGRSEAPTLHRVIAPWNGEVTRGFRNAIGYAALEPRLPKNFDLAAYSVQRMQDPRTREWRTLPNALPRVRVEGSAALEILRDDPMSQSFRTRGDGPHALIVADRHDSDWRCTVDGRATPIEIHAGALRRIPLGAGAHTVDFRYRPPAYDRGMKLSGVGLALLLVLVGFRLSRRS